MPRIAIVGGDERVGRMKWPNGYDVRTYRSSKHSAGDIRRFRAACLAGGVDFAVVLTKFIGHSDERIVRVAGVPFARWSRSPAELTEHLEEVVKIEASRSVIAKTDSNAWIKKHDEHIAAAALDDGDNSMTDSDMMTTQARDVIAPASRARRLGSIKEACLMLGTGLSQTRKLLVRNTVYREEDPARGRGGRPRMLYDLDDVAALADIRRSSASVELDAPSPAEKAPTLSAGPRLPATGLLAMLLRDDALSRARQIKALVDRVDALDARCAVLDAERTALVAERKTIAAEIAVALKAGAENSSGS